MEKLKQKVRDRLRRAYEMGETMGDLVLDDLSSIEHEPQKENSVKREIIKRLKILREDTTRHRQTIKKILFKYGV